MIALAVVADDLTGALDASAPFAERGLRTAVALDRDGLADALASGAEIIGISTDSRELSPGEARQAVADTIARLPAGTRVFKKIDSRLKGNIASELDALHFERALVVPAIPAFGRWVRNGQLGGFGVAEPIDIAARLGRYAQASSIPDTDSQADIARVLEDGTHDLLVGARSLAEALAGVMVPAPPPVSPAHLPATAICVIGSIDPITQDQIARLRAARPDLNYVAAPNGIMPAPPVAAALTIVQATPGDEPEDATTVAERLGRALRDMQPAPGTLLVISGGATAQLVLQALGIGVLHLLGEALPGLPIARAAGFTIITKSGGFGEPDTLARLLGHPGTQERGMVGSS